MMRTYEATEKRYRCDACGYVSRQLTNHYGKTWSFGTYNTCPKCPPFRKFPEFGGQTTWTCLETSGTPDKTEECDNE